MKQKPIIIAGEIYNINFGGMHRPAIIIDDTGDSCIIAPLTTSKLKRSDRQYEIRADQLNGLTFGGPVYINLNRIMSVSKSKIIDRVGKIDEDDLLNIVNLINKEYTNQINSMQLNSYAQEQVEKTGLSVLEFLKESQSIPIETKFDIFLSHSSLDLNEIAGLVTYFQKSGYSIYVDVLCDPDLKPEKVTRNTAQIMRERMNNSKSLLFAFSKNSYKSVWMPWELGYFDGMAKNIAIMPIERVPFHKKKFKGQEYIDLYDYIERDEKDIDQDGLMVVSYDKNRLPIREWIRLASISSVKEYKLSS